MPIKQLQLRGISRTPSDREEWRDIPGFSGKYSASNVGRIRSNIAYNGRGKILGQRARNGYLAVNLFGEDNVRKTYTTHRLVVMAFVGEIPQGMQVNHKNANRLDNRVENLEIVTPSENIKHAYALGLFSIPDNGMKKAVSVVKDGEIIASYESIRDMCRRTGLDRRSVERTLNGTWKQYKGYTFAL